ncbi:OPT oligopeptide transporter protein-domain-containing protein [Lipomyces chichibuensis]|uniref:OPT oligopeptide transporter protein-domain-containing protein n=1 Tax=Lipomyces chichibuensis TaxID=1546026 RepID=UPI0033431E3E
MSVYYEKSNGITPDIGRISVRDSSSISEKKDNITVAVLSFEDREKIIDRIRESGDLEDILDEDAEFMLEKMKTMGVEEAYEILTAAADYHSDDVNFPVKAMRKIRLLLERNEASGLDQESFELDVRLQACLMKYHSPYPEVRAVCKPVDDPTIPAETLRAYLIGIFWVACASFINQLFNFRRPYLYLNSTVIQILVYPTGKLCERILPRATVNIFGKRFSLNNGPWTFKEQMFVTTMTNVGAGSSNFTNYVVVLKLPMFFGLNFIGFGFMFLMNVSSQFFGFGVAGLLRRWVIYPTKAVWPTILPTLQLNKTLLLPETKKNIHGWTISKYKFFFITFTCMFFYFFIPDYLFPALSTFNWITWIAPKNKILAFVTGSNIGMGFNPWPTFDWSVISYSSPLVLPFFSNANRYFGTILGALILAAMYWSNYNSTGYMPPNTSNVYDRTGQVYNLSRVIVDGVLDENRYRQYSPPYISAGNLMNLGAVYALYTLSFVYITMNEWPLISEALRGFIRNLKDRQISNYDRYKDPISLMMKQYPEVPDWWFLIVFVISLAMGIVGLTAYPSTTPVWALIVIILVSLVFLIPTAIIYAVTGFNISVNNLAVLLGGYMVPGNGVANVLCRLYGNNTDEQAESFISDQKLAHYAKLPPRAVFRAQILATAVQVFTTTGAIMFLINGIPDLCSFTQASRFVCTFPHSLYAESLLLGVVGPTRTFNVLYPILKYAFLIGALAAVLFWAIRKRYNNAFKFVHPVLILGGVARWGSTYNLSYYTEGFYVSAFFMVFVRRRYLAWWTKYNYVLSSALTGGVAFSGILIFLALQYHPHKLTWWGTTVQSSGVDGQGVATLYDRPEVGYFGVPAGSWQ